ncbi:MAG: type IV pilus twitching motility protein PilT [Thermoanaerobaculia bacterium]
MSQAESEYELLLGRLALHFKLLTEDQVAEALRKKRQSALATDLGQFLVGEGYLTRAALAKLEQARGEYLKRQAEKGTALPPSPPLPQAPPPASSSAPARGLAPAATASPAAVAKPGAAPPAAQEAPSVLEGFGFRPGVSKLTDLLRRTLEIGASDLHVHSGAPLKVRLHGRLRDVASSRLEPAEAERLLHSILMPAAREKLDEHQQLDMAYVLSGAGRFRVNLYRQQHGLDGVFRAIPARVPTYDDLGLPDPVRQLTEFHQGLVLVTGPAGCGKSSTMAALVNHVATNRTDHVITLEDPIEYVFNSAKGIVNQREVGSHTSSFARALRAALREDPDVIVIGELRDLETIALALTAAETGHLVFGTLHTGSALRTVNRLLGVFPPNQQPQVRTMLSESLRAVVSQRLLPRADGSGRVGAFEVLLNTRAVANLIRENKTFQISSLMQTGASRGMMVLDSSLAELVKSGVVRREEALREAEDPKKLGVPGG